MKFIVAVDCEGVACAVGSPGASLNESRDLEFAKLQATREADACAKGFFDAGAEQVIVWDNHNGSLNLDYDLLDERCDIALGVGFAHRFPGLDPSFTGVAFIGYHAMDNTVDAVMCHTFSSATYQYMKVNGTEVGEMGIDAAVAGSFDVPVVFVASDDKGTVEAGRFCQNVETVTTKDALGWNAAISKHPQRASAEIRAGARAAAERLDDFAPFRFTAPLTLEIRYKRIETAQAASRGLKAGERVDPYTVRWDLDSLADYF
ncbi:MAG: M55 family metallopeptidase [Candidatus Latescibacterota bacterium]|nr:M55 family metallopeptidase [Candidatus Latescibacterota bacterium]